MIHNKKTAAFTLSEMIVVMILTTIVVGLAFSVLTLVQRHIGSIQNNYNHTTELNKLEQSLILDFNRFSTIEFDNLNEQLLFTNELESKTYKFEDQIIVKELDTFHIKLNNKTFYFDGNPIPNGTIDAIKIETTKEFQNKNLFVFKQNDATHFMN